MDANAIAEALRGAVPVAHIQVASSVDVPVVVVDRDSWHEVARALRHEPSLRFQFLSDVLGTDQHPREPRFEVVYMLASLDVKGLAGAASSRRLRVKVPVPGSDAHIATVSDIWPSASWPEREVFDMFGITFDHHPDLRRVLMPEDWEGHPLRKDYPVQIRRAVKVYEPLQVSAEEFASNIDRIRRTSQQTGSTGQTGEKHERKP